ncbi:MAG: aminoacyl-tRNA hydrolase [Lachnospiraceae bacterium]
MYIIAGLGNPTKEYQNTRHNIGFDIIDKLADTYSIDVLEKKHKALVGRGIIEGEKVILAKPQTYMNLSGESVRALVDYYKIDEKQELIVIYDDISLDVGQLRIRKKGSAGGHNGIKSILGFLGHDVFPRIKVGVGDKPAGYDLADYVLGHFTKEERVVMEKSADNAIKAIQEIVAGEIDRAMNIYNKKVKQVE